jgi:hypothetical protein
MYKKNLIIAQNLLITFWLGHKLLILPQSIKYFFNKQNLYYGFSTYFVLFLQFRLKNTISS